MNRNKYLLIVIIPISILIGCEKAENENKPHNTDDVTYIKYGTSFGMCIGYCINEIKVTHVQIELTRSGWEMQESLPDVTKTESINSRYWTGLYNKIDFEAFQQLDTIIGCPDCADGGAEWIEVEEEGKSHKVTFEYYNEPDAVKDYIGYLRAYMHAFRVDSSQQVDFNNRVMIDQKGFLKDLDPVKCIYLSLLGVVTNGDTVYYYDLNMGPIYKKSSTDVVFNGVLAYDSTLLYRFNPHPKNDLDYKVRNISTFGMRYADVQSDLEPVNCVYEFPLEELKWLKDIKTNLEMTMGMAGWQIIQYKYKGESVFWIDPCYQCPDGLISVYNCSGNILCEFGGIDGRNTCLDFYSEATDSVMLFDNVQH